MIVTRNWLNEWIDISNVSTEKICKTLNEIGLEVDSVKKYKIAKNVVVGYVNKCEKHPNADKLSVCDVQIGKTSKQIVCGAKNIASGQFVPVALVGAQLPGGLEIKKTKIRDIDSYGMICSSEELGLPKMGDGILVLDESIGELIAGKELCEYPLLNDDVIDIELTANRGDCLSIYGVARDLSVPLDLDIKEFVRLEDEENRPGVGRVLQVDIQEKIDSTLIYKVFSQNNISSSLLIDLRLAIAQLEKEDPLERLVAYASYSTGVLLRVYKQNIFTKSKSGIAHIVIKKDKNGIDAVYNKKIVSLVGISQEADSKANKSDKNIILEASYIDPEIISKKSATVKLFKDEYFYRSSRGSEPDLQFGIEYFKFLANLSCDIHWYAGVQQIEQDVQCITLNVDLDRINKLIGQQIEKSMAVKILKKLGFEIDIKNDRGILSVVVPRFRHDIKNEQDIVEEIVRIVGIDNIKSSAAKFKESNRINSSYINFKKRLSYRQKAASSGFFESVHYIFDDREKLKRFSFETISKKRDLANPITNELNTLRTTLLIHLIEAASKNIRFGKKSIRLFEVGKVFDKDRNESNKISFLFSGEVENANLKNHGKPETISFFEFAKRVSNIIGDFSILPSTEKNALINPYEYGRVVLGKKDIGYISRVHLQIEKEFGLPPTYVCEFDFDKLPFERKIAEEFSKFPATSRDLSILIPKQMQYLPIREFLHSILPKEIESFYPIDLYESEDLGDKMSLTLKFILCSFDKTLNDEEIKRIMDDTMKKLKEKFDIGIR
jgi:phenylalanyl-tRNA synthetase beta chain